MNENTLTLAQGLCLTCPGLCSTCGAPAVTAWRPMKNVTEPGDVWERWEPDGLVYFGCAEHPERPWVTP
jgi:hypothetical protein